MKTFITGSPITLDSVRMSSTHRRIFRRAERQSPLLVDCLARLPVLGAGLGVKPVVHLHLGRGLPLSLLWVALVQFPLIRASENKIGKLGIRKLAEIRKLERSLHNHSKPLFTERPTSTYLGE